MKLKGTECPFCHKSFTLKEVENMLFVCPTCLSDKTKVVFSDSYGVPQFGVSVARAKYSAIVDMVQKAIDANMGISFVCKNCAAKYNTTSFYLVAETETE